MKEDIFNAPVGFWKSLDPERHLFIHAMFIRLLCEIRENGGIAKFIEICTDKEKLEFCKKHRYSLGESEKMLLK